MVLYMRNKMVGKTKMSLRAILNVKKGRSFASRKRMSNLENGFSGNSSLYSI